MAEEVLKNVEGCLPAGLLDEDVSGEQLQRPLLTPSRHLLTPSSAVSPSTIPAPILSPVCSSIPRPIFCRSAESRRHFSETERKEMEPIARGRTFSCSPAMTQRTMTTGQKKVMSATSARCSYCASICKPSEGHTNKRCPVLASLGPCPHCGACGYDNHTPSHCPQRPVKEVLLKSAVQTNKVKRNLNAEFNLSSCHPSAPPPPKPYI